MSIGNHQKHKTPCLQTQQHHSAILTPPKHSKFHTKNHKKTDQEPLTRTYQTKTLNYHFIDNLSKILNQTCPISQPSNIDICSKSLPKQLWVQKSTFKKPAHWYKKDNMSPKTGAQGFSKQLPKQKALPKNVQNKKTTSKTTYQTNFQSNFQNKKHFQNNFQKKQTNFQNNLPNKLPKQLSQQKTSNFQNKRLPTSKQISKTTSKFTTFRFFLIQKTNKQKKQTKKTKRQKPNTKKNQRSPQANASASSGASASFVNARRRRRPTLRRTRSLWFGGFRMV